MGPTKVYISHKNLLHNFNLIQEAVAPAGVMGVVKANAYGHGIVEAAHSLVKAGAAYLGVAFPEEGLQLRQAGIRTPILVFGAQNGDLFEMCLENNLEITLTDGYQLERLRKLYEKTGKKAKVHIKVDTGMNRFGFPYETFDETILNIFDLPYIDVKGVYTHFSSADEENPSYTLFQLERFLHVKEIIRKHNKSKLLFHAANSAAIMKFPQAYLDLVRPGVMLYGNPPGPDFKLSWPLKEVMRFVSQVTLIKELKPDEAVSYNCRFYTRKNTRIAVIPVGYADGYSRQLTNRAQVLIRGRRFPVVGTVCMDAIMVNLEDSRDIRVGDEVVLFGAQGDEHITIVEMSRLQDTIPYEVTCRVSARVPREHLK